MTFNELQRQLTALEARWRAGEICDQDFDIEAANAAIDWARAAQKREPNPNHQCPHCKWGFWNQRVLEQHIQEQH